MDYVKVINQQKEYPDADPRKFGRLHRPNFGT